MKDIIEKWFSITQNSSSYLSQSVQELVLEKGIAEKFNDGQQIWDTDLLDLTNLTSILMNDGTPPASIFFGSYLCWFSNY